MQPTEMQPILELNDVSLSFGGLHAVKQVSFAVPEGQITSLIGPNGAGKTTVFNIICGILRSQEGTISYQGEYIEKKKPYEIARMGLARTFQAPRIFSSMSVIENVMIGVRQRGEHPLWAVLRGRRTNAEWRAVREKSEQVLHEVGLLHRANDPSQDLSFGEQRYLSIARTLVSNPNLILMDEPTVGLDVAGMERLVGIIRRSVNERKVTVLLIEHNMELVMSLSDRVTLMVHGRVVTTGSPGEVRAHSTMAEAYLGKRHVA